MDTSSERIPHPGSAAPGGFDDHGVILASGSPRRAAILRAAGVEPQVIVPAIDDADAPADRMEPARMVMALAWSPTRCASMARA
jgi:predicted house-cleaning NTP pyrophosphatase (Maf/HAM1 superfamily)